MTKILHACLHGRVSLKKRVCTINACKIRQLTIFDDGRVISRLTERSWTPRGQDLSPLDYYFRLDALVESKTEPSRHSARTERPASKVFLEPEPRCQARSAAPPPESILTCKEKAAL